MEVVFFKSFLLPASGVEILAKISFLVEQANGDERESKIAGGFEMIAGEYAKASGKDGEAFGDAKFQGKIGDEYVENVAVFALEPGALAGEISVEAFRDTWRWARKESSRAAASRTDCSTQPSSRTGLRPTVSQRSRSKRRNRSMAAWSQDQRR